MTTPNKTNEPKRLKDEGVQQDYDNAIKQIQILREFFRLEGRKEVSDSLRILILRIATVHIHALKLEAENTELKEQLDQEVESDEEGYHNMAETIRDLEEENQELRVQLRSKDYAR